MEYPKISVKRGLRYSNVPSGLASAMPTGELSERIRKRSSLSMSACSMRLRSVMSVSMTMARRSSMRAARNSRIFALPSRQVTWKTRALPLTLAAMSAFQVSITFLRYSPSGNAFRNHSFPVGMSSRAYPVTRTNSGLA